MTMRSWIRKLFTQPVARTICKAPRRNRLAVEMLEDRLAPATITVLTNGDATGELTSTGVNTYTAPTLRAAIAGANTMAGADTIDFDSVAFSTAQTITLGVGGWLRMTDTSGATTITGPGADLLSVNGNRSTIVFAVKSDVTASISGLTITNGLSHFSGGGVRNFGSTTLTNCIITGNTVINGGGGYPINEYGQILRADGGGLYNAEWGVLTLNNCTVSDNGVGGTGGGYGGGLANLGRATLNNCTVSGNASRGGGGVWNNAVNLNFTGYGRLTMLNCTISSNKAANIVGGAFGGGVSNVNQYGLVQLLNCTLSGNFAGNLAGTYTGVGGGLSNSTGARAEVTNCTISGNTGGGVRNTGTAGLSNTIVTDGVNGGISGSNNLIGGNAMLGPLGDYGGPTQTLPLLPGSPAIDAGTSAIPAAVAQDQRGKGRVGAIDIGAFESQGFTLTPVAGSTPQTAAINSAFANPLAVTVAANNPGEPVNGGVITFTAPVFGPSATLSASTAMIAGASASVTATSSGKNGSYTVTATAAGANTGSFSLVNFAPKGPPVSYVVNTTSASIVPGTGLLSLPKALLLANGDNADSSITFDPTVFATPKSITQTIDPPQLYQDSRGGGLSGNANYYYRISAVTSTGEETGASPEAYVRTGFTFYGFSMQLYWDVVPGAVSYNVYRGTTSGGEQLLTSVNAPPVSSPPNPYQLVSFIDDGSRTIPTGAPFAPSWLTLRDLFATDTITGPAAGVTISGGGLSTFENATFEVAPGVTASLSGLTITGGTSGVSIDPNAVLALADCTVSGNTKFGVAVIDPRNTLSGGTATLTNCTISGNGNSSFSGGGVGVTNGTATLTDCTISGNTGGSSGGGVSVTNSTVTLTNSTVSATAGVGVRVNSGTATLTNNTLSGNTGAGVRVITGTATLTNNTLSGNTGAGVRIESGTATLTNNTVSGNGSAGGVRVATGATATLINTIVAGTAAGGADVIGVVTSHGNNLIGNIGTTTDWVDTDLTGTSTELLDPLLGPLADNGGPTLTMALLSDSPAIDAGNSVGAPSGDQRDYSRVGNVDIGAFEFGGVPRQSQTITFGPLANTTYGDADFTISATATSELPVSFTVSGDATVYEDTDTGVWYVHIEGAGSATIMAHQDGDAIYRSAMDVTQSFNIAKADAVIVVDGYAGMYDGLYHGATLVSATGVNGEDLAASVTMGGEIFKDVSAGLASWSFSNSNYISQSSNSVAIDITQADASVVVTPYTVTYDGQPHTASVASITGVNGETGATVGTVTLSAAHTNAGTYSDSWSFAGTGNYKNISSTTITNTIDKADAVVVVTPYTVTYDGQPHTASVASITGVNGETGEAVGTVDVSNTTHTNAGTYSDSWSFAGTGNYEDISTTITDTINKASSTTVILVSGPFTYTGLPQTPATVTVTGAVGLSLTPAADYSNNVNAGTATASYDYAGDANHEASSDSKTFIIGKADATVTVTPYAVTYDGQPHTASYTITGVNGETGAAVGTVRLSTTHTNPGTYSDSWSFAGDPNYNDIASTPITDTINKAALFITANNDTKVYGTQKTFGGTAFTQTGLVAGDAITGVTETSPGSPTSAAVGNYPIVPDFATGTGLDNYDITYVNGTLTVTDPITQFDFQPSTSSPLQAGSLAVLPGTGYTVTRGYGWTKTPGRTTDAGALPSLSGNPLAYQLRDYMSDFGGLSSADIFRFDLASANPVQITAFLGDASTNLDGIEVAYSTNGVNFTPYTPGGGLSIPAGKFTSATSGAIAPILSGGIAPLWIRFQDIGGSTSNWSAAGFVIRPVASVGTLSVLAPQDTSADGMTPDWFTVTGATPGAVLTISASLGTILTDARPELLGNQVIATDGTAQFQICRPFVNGTSTITVSDFTGAATTTITQSCTLVTARKFDMNYQSPSLPDASWIDVRTTSLYTPTAGYGWTSAPSATDTATNYPASSTAAQQALYRDYHSGMGTNTFRAYVGSGQRTVKLYTFAPGIAGMTVSLEGGAFQPVSGSSTTFNATVGPDGILDITFRSAYPFTKWAVNAVDVF